MEPPQQLAWTPEEIARFWDYWSAREDSQETYFALQVGAGVVQFAEHIRPLRGQHVLDFGSGPGHLVEHLLTHGAHVSAADHSPNSVVEVENRFRGRPGWNAAKTFDNGRLAWEDNTFDMAFCLETIEHLHDADCQHIFTELWRVLKPGGVAVFTTPHAEDLKRQQVFCPCCRTEFHRWQHLRSWTEADLESALADRGYAVPFCRGLSFHDFQPPQRGRWKMQTWKRQVREWWWKRCDDVSPRPFPHGRAFARKVRRSDGHHLAAVAQKPTDSATVPRSKAA